MIFSLMSLRRRIHRDLIVVFLRVHFVVGQKNHQLKHSLRNITVKIFVSTNAVLLVFVDLLLFPYHSVNVMTAFVICCCCCCFLFSFQQSSKYVYIRGCMLINICGLSLLCHYEFRILRSQSVLKNQTKCSACDVRCGAETNNNLCLLHYSIFFFLSTNCIM